MSEKARSNDRENEVAPRLRAILDTAVDAIITIDERGIIESANPATERLFGWSEAELRGRNVSILMPSPDQERHDDYLRNYLRTGEAKVIGIGRETIARHRDGREFPIELSVSEVALADRRLFTGFVRDVSERVKAQTELATRVRQQAAVATLGQAELLGAGVDDTLVAASAALADGLRMELVKILELLPDDSGVLLRAGVGWKAGLVGHTVVPIGKDSQAGYTLAAGGPVIVEDMTSESRFSGPALLHEHGVVSGLSVPIEGDDRPWGVLGVHSRERRSFSEEDVHFVQSVANVLAESIRRQRAEEALQRSEARYRSLVQTAGVLIVVLDADRSVIEWNHEAERLFGVSRDEAIGRDGFELILPPGERDRAAAELERVLGGGLSTGYENCVVTRSGELRTVLWNAKGLPDETGQVTAVISCGQDITERKRLLAELGEKETLAKLGEMAAVVAHEVKNPLAAIKGAIEVLGGRLREDREVVGEIVGRIDELADVISDLLVFSRPPTLRLSAVPLRGLIEDAVERIRTDPIFEKVDLSIEGDDPRVPLDTDRIRAVVTNLLLNAAQAMQGQGAIEVRVVHAADGVEVTVTDTGPGIPEEARPKIFEPFFTTKARGTGLGLPIARRLIEAHGGELQLEEAFEGGTRFRLRLPAPPA